MPASWSRAIASGRGVAIVAGALIIIALIAAGCGSDSKSNGDTAAATASSTTRAAAAEGETGALGDGLNIAGKEVLFIHSSDSGNPFDVPVVSGSDAAAKLTGLKVNTQFSDGDATKLRNLFQSGISRKVAGIITAVPDASLNKQLCAARRAGIPVIVWNINGATGEGASCVMAYVGQDFRTTGAVIAQRMVDDGKIKQGDRVFCPVEYPNFSYATERAAGVNQVLKPLGTKCDMLGVGVDEAKSRSTEAQYLLGHRDTKAVIGLGGPSQSVVLKALKQARLKDVAVGGFDLSSAIVKGIKDGDITATVDQQPYSQGFMSVMQLALYLKYGLFPSSIPTGGTGLIDKNNVDLVSSLVPKYR
jgi:simple sugar transport system substrate-binding protein